MTDDARERAREMVDAVYRADSRGGAGDADPSARADLYRRLGRMDDARAAYQRELELVREEPERRFLEKRLRELHHA